MFDLFQSRATYNEPCKWWTRDERDKYTSDELIMRRIPSGVFVAKEVTAEQRQDMIISGTFLFDRSNITIKSPDNLKGIKQDDIVLFRNEKWLVVNVQKTKSKTQNTYFADSKNCSHYWYLELRK